MSLAYSTGTAICPEVRLLSRGKRSVLDSASSGQMAKIENQKRKGRPGNGRGQTRPSRHPEMPELRLLERMLDTAHAIALVLDPEGRIVRFNEHMAELTGYPLDEVRGCDWFATFLPQRDRDGVGRLFHASLAGPPVVHNINPIVCKDGTQREIQWSGITLRNEDEEILGHLSIGIDVTQTLFDKQAQLDTERQLDTLLANLPGFAYRCLNEPDWKALYLSGGALALTGYQPAELTDPKGTPYGELIHSEDRDRVWRDVQNAVSERRRFQLEYRIRTASGEERVVWEQGTAVETRDGRRVLEGYITDVTDRSRAQAQLEVSEARLRRAQALAGLGNFESWAPFGPGNAYWSDEMFAVAGRDPALGPLDLEAWLNLIHPDDRSRVTECWQLTPERPTAPPVEYRLTHPDGSVRHVRAILEADFDEDRRCVRHFGAIQDITEQRRSIDALRRRDAVLGELIATTQDAVVFVDAREGIVEFNAAAERVFGYTKSEVLGKNVAVLMPEPHASAHHGYVERYERTGEARAVGRVRTVTGRRKDGTLFPIELSVAALRADPDVPYAAFIRDTTEKTELQARAIEKERLSAVGMAAAAFAHEVGNPLNNMYLHAQTLDRRLQRLNAGERAQADVKSVLEQTRRLNTLLDEFRMFYRRDHSPLRATDVRELLRTVIEFETIAAQQRRVQIREHYAPTVPPVHGNPDKLSQVFVNLSKNAIEAMPDGGVLTIRVAVGGPDRVRIEITDTGVGIEPDVDVFEPFRTTKRDGTGLGLAIVRQIVEAHGGEISHTTEPGRGTTFCVLLPKAPDT